MKHQIAALDLLFPKARAEILRLLFSDWKKERYVRELMVMSGLALRTVQEELAILSALHLVESRSNGYHRFYRANRQQALSRHLSAMVRASQRLPSVKPPPHRLRARRGSKRVSS